MTHSARAPQSGVTLIFVLILLVVLMLGGLALMRTVNTGTMVSGNLAFKRSATYSADFGIEQARNWLMSSTALDNDDPAHGYYAQRRDALTDFIAQVNWDGGADKPGQVSKALIAGQDAAGNTIAYVIHRLCKTEGTPNTVANPCETAAGGGGGVSSKRGFGYGGGVFSGQSTLLYRVTVRVTGPRNTSSYVQSVLLL